MTSPNPVEVEIHIPLSSEPDQGPHEWLDNDYVEQFLFQLEERGEVRVSDEGEESVFSGTYAYGLSGPDEATVLAAASEVARLPLLPAGVYAIVKRRVELPVE